MRINLKDVDRSIFHVREHYLNGHKLYLTYPRLLSFEFWTPDNLIFRSSLWNENGELVSASFPKFFNLGERRDLFPIPPSNLEGVNIIEKLDGSALIVSKYKDTDIIRTRRQLNARYHPNGDEIDILSKKYPGALEGKQNISYIYEWLSPRNTIIIKSMEPDIYLVGAIRHEDYSLYNQLELDVLANELDVPRPRICNQEFESLSELIKYLLVVEGIEGYCLYYDNDQKILKVKSDWYLAKHRAKAELTEKRIRELFINQGCPDKNTFEETLKELYDFESLEEAFRLSDNLYRKYEDYLKKVESIKETLQQLPEDASQKEKAEHILNVYSDSIDRGIAFSLSKTGNVDLSKFTLRTQRELLGESDEA